MSKPELGKTETRVEQADARAREIERQMTDEERFSLIISLSGATGLLGGMRDKRYPEDAPLTAGYTPGVPRLGQVDGDAQTAVAHVRMAPEVLDDLRPLGLAAVRAEAELVLHSSATRAAGSHRPRSMPPPVSGQANGPAHVADPLMA